jgi:integrase
MPAHHKAEDYVDAYIEAAGLEDQRKQPLFRSAVGKSKRLSGNRMTRYATLKMIQRRARKAGILTPICCHSFRATPGDEDSEKLFDIPPTDLATEHQSS